jgi:hypothetical protein
MTNIKDITSEVAENLSIERDDVAAVLEEFMLQLHRRIVEHDGLNGDYIGEQLWSEVSPQAYFHFLGFLDRFSERYSWEAGSANEYIARLYRPAECRPFSHQMGGWKEAKFYRERKHDLHAEENK